LTLKVGIFPEIDHLGGGWRRKQRGRQCDCTDRASVTHGHPPWIRQWERAAAAPSAIIVVNVAIEYLCTENLDSNILMTQSANQGLRDDVSDPLNRARDWLSLLKMN
jgi:hypothetical protein